MSVRLKKEVTDAALRYIAGWADSANKRRHGAGGATDPTLIFQQGQADGMSPSVTPSDPVRFVSSDLEAAIVARFRHEITSRGPMFLQLDTGPQLQILYQTAEAIGDEVLDTGSFVPVPAKKEEPATPAEPPAPREPLFATGKPFRPE